MATYHGLIEVECIACKWMTKDESTMEMLNDLSGECPECKEQFFRWVNEDNSIVVSLIDEQGNYDNLIMKGN